jgi:protein-tyrosine phosphatase
MPYADLHCHILPGLDDGSRSLSESLNFARRLDAEGVRDVAATPHIKHTHHPFQLSTLAPLRAKLQQAIDEAHLDVTVHRGGELAHEDALTLDPEELELIAQGPEHAPWLLLECPFEGLDDIFDAAAARLQGLGYGLLLAHPERADSDIELLRPHLEHGALLQVNVSSLLGHHGPRPKRVGEQLVRTGLAYCLASDTHPGTREATLPQGLAALARLGVNEIQATRLTQSNPRFLLREGITQLALERANSLR